jgi:hypothetical protein
MEPFYMLTESDFHKWFKEAMVKYFDTGLLPGAVESEREEPLLSRKEVALRLRISLVTLNDWVKRGLPSHKQRGKVYFLDSEVMAYIKKKQFRKFWEVT